MSSDQSSFREMFEYPNEGLFSKQRKYMLKGHRNKRTPNQPQKKKQTFYDVVQKAKNVALFAQNLKQRIAENRSLDAHTLKRNELEYLENDSQSQSKSAFFSCENKIILTFELVYVLTNLLYLWQCTFEIVFGEIATNELINGVTLLFYLLHVALFQLTEHKNEKSELVADLSQIREVYLGEKMAKDSISLAVIILQLTPLDSEDTMQPLFMVLRVLSILSWFQLSATIEKVQNLLVISMQSEIINSLLKLVFKILVFLHCLSMMLNLLVSVEHYFNIENTWLSNENLSYSSNIEKYVIGWYWGSTILSTVGFGEIIPANNVERFFISIVQVVCCMTFGYFVNAIGEIIKMNSESQEKYQKQIRKLNRYLQEISLSNDLKHKIRTHYFNKHLVEQNHDPNEEKEVLTTITPNLKASLLEEVNVKIIKKCTPLDSFRSETIKNIAERIKRTILAPEYLLYSRHMPEKKLWFIESGIVEEQTDNFEHSKLRKVLSIYNEKQPLVGWINFLIPGCYRTAAKAINFTIAHELGEADFVDCFRDDASEYHKFVEMKHRMLEKNRKFESKCISCGRYTHNAINCPRIHLVKKDGYKIAMQRRQLDRFREEQLKKTERSGFKYNWKCLHGTKQLEREAQFLNHNDHSSDIPKGTIEGYLKKLGFRESVCNKNDQRRKASVCVIVPKQVKGEGQQGRELWKSQIADKSMVSLESDEQEMGFEFEKAFYNKEAKSYMPQNDIEQILAEYRKKVFKKKLNVSANELIPPFRM